MVREMKRPYSGGRDEETVWCHGTMVAEMGQDPLCSLSPGLLHTRSPPACPDSSSALRIKRITQPLKVKELLSTLAIYGSMCEICVAVCFSREPALV